MHLKRGSLALPNGGRACEEFELDALHDALRTLHCHASPDILNQYGEGDGRGGARTREQLEEHLAAEAAHVAAHPEAVVVEAA